MTVPREYALASAEFEAFLIDVRTFCDHQTTHQAYHTATGVFRAFRRRLTIAEALLFADALPPLLRAMFVEDWRADQTVVREIDGESLLRDVRSHGRHHNFAPDDAVACVARAVLAHVDRQRFELALRALPGWAAALWGLPGR